MDVKAMLDMAKDDGLELHIPTHTICMATALRSELSKWLKKLIWEGLGIHLQSSGNHLSGFWVSLVAFWYLWANLKIMSL